MPRNYVICTTPRSGSTLLCKLLASTGRTGNPDSFYHRAEFMRDWAAEWGLPDAGTMSRTEYDRAYLAAAMAAGTGGTAIFGQRLQQPYLALLSDTLDRIYPGLASDTERFARAFGNVLYIHLTRADKVAQAVSLVKAEQSGLWHVNADGTELERLSEPQEPIYDFHAIHTEVLALQRAEASWHAWFDEHQVKPLRISYEDFANRPAETLIDICTALGVDAPERQTVKPQLAKLSDATSLAWRERYGADLRAAGGDGEASAS